MIEVYKMLLETQACVYSYNLFFHAQDGSHGLVGDRPVLYWWSNYIHKSCLLELGMVKYVCNHSALGVQGHSDYIEKVGL